MSQRSSDQGGVADRDWPDDLWPDDDDQAGLGGPAGEGNPPGKAEGPPTPPGEPRLAAGGAEAAPDGAGAAPGGAGAPGRTGGPPMPAGGPETAPRKRRVQPGVLAVIIVAAAAAGAGIAAVAVHDLSSPTAIASGGTGPGTTGPGGQGAPGGALPAGGGAVPGGGTGAGPGQAGSLFLIGTVTAVSRTSITIGGPGHTITAAVTGATRVSGKVSAVSGIKVGDRVSAQITQGGTGNVAVAIADPAQLSTGASLP